VASGVTLSAATETGGHMIEFDTKPGASYELLS
jgi:hypothetical protein